MAPKKYWAALLILWARGGRVGDGAWGQHKLNEPLHSFFRSSGMVTIDSPRFL